jgi:hypothetical protein
MTNVERKHDLASPAYPPSMLWRHSEIKRHRCSEIHGTDKRYTCHRWNWQQPSVGWWQCSRQWRETNSIVFVITGTRIRSYRRFSGATRNWMNCIRIQTDSCIIVNALRQLTDAASRNYYYLLRCDADQSGKKFTDVSEECYSTI